MGYLEQALAALDSARRTGGRNIQDLFSDPSAYAEKVVGHLRNTNAGVAPVATPTELTNRPLTLSERVNDTLNSVDFGGGLGAIKPKGGNWLSGKYGVDKELEVLRKSPGSFVPIGELTPDTVAAGAVKSEALNSFIDRQISKYVKNDMASPTDPIRKLADAWPEEKAQKLAVAEARVQKLRQKQQAQAATRGVPEEYLTQTRQDVLKAEEVRDLIAENTGLHFAPLYGVRAPETLTALRKKAGQEPFGVAQSPLARQWENTADYMVIPRKAKDFKLPSNLARDPWLANQADDAPVYVADSAIRQDAGFEHLIDELANSLRAGRLTPEQLAKMPIDQAVRHVAEINALRKVTAGKQQAMDASEIPVFKDYPEQGMSWRQLKVPELTPERIKYLESQYPENNAEYGLEHVNSRDLQKWLTQEGDAMGHCVGGYCDDVASGQSEIYSLRDAKGKPHVTIETSPKDFASGAPLDAPRIVQIKGPNNRSPDPKYFPLIQDFIRSGKWSDIRDVAHTGLSRDEINAILKR